MLRLPLILRVQPQVLADRFAANSEHSVELAIGSTGLLYAQILQGAPFDVLLAADRDRPERLVLDGLGDSDSLFVICARSARLLDAKS